MCRTGRLVRSRALSHARDIARLSAVTSSQSPDAARLLPSRVDWLPGTFTCFSWVFVGAGDVVILALYTSPCAHSFPLGDTIRFICTRSTSSSCADMHLTPSSRQSQDAFSQCYPRRDLRLQLAIMPTGSVVCMCSPPMRDVGTCPMIEATYLRNTRPSMPIDESVARSQIRMWQKCVCVALLLATKSRRFVL